MHGFKVGDEVYSYSWDNPQGGFYAEYVAVPEVNAWRVPVNVPLEVAAIMAHAASTALPPSRRTCRR